MRSTTSWAERTGRQTNSTRGHCAAQPGRTLWWVALTRCCSLSALRSMCCSVPEALDEDDLMAELDSMEGELEAETDEVPSYLVNAATASKTAATSSSPARREEKSNAYPEVEVDELGLPSVPVRSVQI